MVGLRCILDINCVMMEELEGLNGVGRIIVKSIVDVWIVLGGFLSIENLFVILGIGYCFIDLYKDVFCCFFLFNFNRREIRGFVKVKIGR